MSAEQKPLVPELRFPEFEGEWESFKLGKYCVKVGSGVTPKGGASTYVLNGIPLIRSQNVKDDRLNLSDVVFIDSETDAKMSGSRVFANDVLLNITGASIGRSCVFPDFVGSANVNQHVCIIRLKASLLPSFIQSLLSSHKGQKLISQTQAGGGREGLNFENIRSFKMSAPEKDEQTKIASFLDAVSKKIELLNQKKAALEEYMRGLMQKLFSGTLRFTRPDGSAFPDWEEKKLGDVSSVVGGGTPDSSVPEYWDGDINWFTPSEVKSKYLGRSARTISQIGLKKSSAKMLPAGALIMSTRATVGEVGIACGPCTTNQGFQSLIVNPLQSNEYWYYWIKSHKHEFLRRSAGSTFLEINKLEVSKMPVSVPHLDEQTKIADALSALDAKIDAVSAQISQMETFKKGLLQKMFV